MLLKTQYTELVMQAKPLQNKIDEFKQYTVDNNLPFTTDYALLMKVLKVNLFHEYMSVDKSLEYEFKNMLKTEQAKAQRIESKINLDGYEQPVIVCQYLSEIKEGVKRFNSANYTLPNMIDSRLISEYNGSIGYFYKQYIVGFAGLEKEKKLAEDFTDILNKVLKLGVYFQNIDSVTNLFNNALLAETSGGGISKVSLNYNALYDLLKFIKHTDDD